MAAPSRPARLWYQSFVHPTEQAPYIERLQASLDAAASPDVRFEVHRSTRSSFPSADRIPLRGTDDS